MTISRNIMTFSRYQRGFVAIACDRSLYLCDIPKFMTKMDDSITEFGDACSQPIYGVHLDLPFIIFRTVYGDCHLLSTTTNEKIILARENTLLYADKSIVNAVF